MGDLRQNPDTTTMSNVKYDETSAYNDKNLFIDSYSVSNLDTDGVTGFETAYTPDWSKWFGYYKQIPEFQSVVDKLGSWTVGRGFKADEKNMKKINSIRGFGKDDFNSLLENFIRTMLIGGDSFSEIMRDSAGRVINIKPLNPGSMRIIANRYGIIDRYEQIMRNPMTGKITVINKFKTKEIFHLAWNRIADEIHGIPFAEKAEKLIEMRNESMQDQRVLFHRYIKPIHWIEASTDDATELNILQTKLNQAYKKSENIIIPKGTVGELKTMSMPEGSTLDPLPWLNYLVRQFVTALGMPEIILGWGANTTEASAKIIYLAYQQTIEKLQRFVEQQVENQLSIKFKLTFPASLEEDMKKDERKDSNLNTERKSETKP